MYESFYGLSDKPFQLNPDPSFYFGSQQHRRAMSYLEYGIHQSEGFIVITGEIGAGKTTLVRSLFEKLDSTKVLAAHMVTTQLDASDTLRIVAAAFGLESARKDKAELLLGLEAFFVATAAEGKRCLLVVDEAQNLTPAAVEELRMLSNFQLETHALLQTFLVGQPEFRNTLQSPTMEQLRQRIIATAHIGAMSATETQGYIEHRLGHVGWSGIPRFAPDAFLAIHEHSGGIPRRINAICDRLLWYGFLGDKKAFARNEVLEVAEEMRSEFKGQPTVVIGSGESPAGSSPSQLDLPMSAVAGSGVHDQLALLDRDLLRLESTLLRIERNHLESTKLSRRMVKALEQGRDET
ncbi:MAG: AAA family ATPase [Betaproteobacteria bacterium]|nr:AAA family ATPase [Betaproteobacteria bacterium]